MTPQDILAHAMRRAKFARDIPMVRRESAPEPIVKIVKVKKDWRDACRDYQAAMRKAQTAYDPREAAEAAIAAREIKEAAFREAVAAIPKTTTEQIIRVVAEHFGLTVALIKGHQRAPQYVIPRHIAIYITSELTGNSLPVIGRAFGDRDHTTVMHAIRKIKARINDDPDFAALITELMGKVE